MSRGMTGLLPLTGSLADESYLDFVETFRARCVQRMYPQLDQLGTAQVARELGRTDESVPLEALRESINRVPLAPLWQRLMRSHQEMMWRRTRASFLPAAAKLEAAMAGAEKQGPGELVFDPGFVVPDYARFEVHLQPGGYTDDPIGGVVYHYGTHVFYQGDNEQDALHEELARSTTPPVAGCVGRVLDLACSIGQATITLKHRFPSAEVTGLDVGLPLLRYAHLRAVERKVDVRFVQALAEDMPFPDGHFDMVMAYILFHEIPWRITEKVVPEVARVLRPGGTFSIFEFPSAGQNLSPVARFLIDYDSRDNVEPYSPEFVRGDFHGLLRDSGFDVAPGPRLSNGFLQSIVATRR
jgi:SAM-dependent methyltransferase